MAWLGGGAFAAALAYLVYFYAVTLADPAAASGRSLPIAILINLAMFALFALHHSVFARAGAKRWVRRVVPAALERTLYVLVASALLVLVCVWWQPLPGLVYEAHGLARFGLFLAQGTGAVLTIAGARLLDPRSLAGISGFRGSGVPGFRGSVPEFQGSEVSGFRGSGLDQPEPLEVAGPFGLVRHPIYLGWVLMVAAAPTLTVNRLVFAAISSAYLILAIPWEERSLVEVHGDRYRDYQRAVRWRLLPGIW